MSNLHYVFPNDAAKIITPIRIVDSFSVEVNRAVLFTSADLNIVLFDSSGNLIQALPMTISCDDADNLDPTDTWTGSDNQIIDIVYSKLGFTPADAPASTN
jgi:hypothetical protein